MSAIHRGTPEVCWWCFAQPGTHERQAGDVTYPICDECDGRYPVRQKADPGANDCVENENK